MKKGVEDLVQYTGTLKLIFSNEERQSVLPDSKFDRKEILAEHPYSEPDY